MVADSKTPKLFKPEFESSDKKAKMSEEVKR
jgi:hypothetical protein